MRRYVTKVVADNGAVVDLIMDRIVPAGTEVQISKGMMGVVVNDDSSLYDMCKVPKMVYNKMRGMSRQEVYYGSRYNCIYL